MGPALSTWRTLHCRAKGDQRTQHISACLLMRLFFFHAVTQCNKRLLMSNSPSTATETRFTKLNRTPLVRTYSRETNREYNQLKASLLWKEQEQEGSQSSGLTGDTRRRRSGYTRVCVCMAGARVHILCALDTRLCLHLHGGRVRVHICVVKACLCVHGGRVYAFYESHVCLCAWWACVYLFCMSPHHPANKH